jgi:hypothetical protein
VNTLRPDIPPHCAAVIARCLEKNRDERYASIAALASELERYVQQDQDSVAKRIARMSVASGSVPNVMSGQTMPLLQAPTGRGPSQLPGQPVPAAGSSNRISGGTNISWGETSLATSGGVGSPPSKAPIGAIVGVLVAVLAVGGAGSVGFLMYRDHGKPTTVPSALPSAGLLPEDRTLLPPLPSASTASSVKAATSLPDERGAITGPGTKPSATAITTSGRKPPTGGTGGQGTVVKPPTGGTGGNGGLPDERK